MKRGNIRNGFIYPFTVMLVLLFFMTAIHLTNLLVIEKKYYADTKKFYFLQHLTYSGAAQSTKMIKEGFTGAFDIKDTYGTIHITIMPLSPDTKSVSMEMTLNKETKYYAYYEYSIAKQLISKWYEW
ncbi:competence type IV pilus minor pilin ComGG [Metabacillus sp. FJAT-52054]|uniref:Competence type IV pilus minor pilin ComGG n=1 Tax=Metabacillus sediminis TaxID=3117746 RepID=A0ABZ2NDE0_9BACI